ncbi:PREDICTED: (Z)-3-hexen-1-ol acetyltransferase-like [Tarenaya hassleriana]|uniref:(Z)-3-hexen-1-ol acetyltransferase-like n=1 Tax=Tarenaya hassleriana TaxID=28532 RepID=UPI00053C07FB|nr:PREDICTED: (Z)-3-hexen-1-ol acetyltransferase-like [Tarenaya hassleriana]
MVLRSFFFGSQEISAIRRLIPPELGGRVTTFDLLASFLWHCRTIALNRPPVSKMRLAIAMSHRDRERTIRTTSGICVKAGARGEIQGDGRAGDRRRYGIPAVSDVRRLGLDDVDLGWGPPVHGGLTEGARWGISWLIPWKNKNKNGETRTVVQVILPEPAMERFAEQLALVFDTDQSIQPIRSSL